MYCLSIITRRTEHGTRLCFIALSILLVLSSQAAWAELEANAPVKDAVKTVVFSPGTRVMVFQPGAGQWTLTTYSRTQPGSEFYSNNRLYRAVDTYRARIIADITGGKLAEADLPYDDKSRRPTDGDVVQVLDKDLQFAEHAVFGTVTPGAAIRFQGKVYNVKADHSLTDTKITYAASECALQRITVTSHGLRHITDRHTTNGKQNAGKSIFHAAKDIKALIKDAELASPTIEENGYLKRDVDAGRNIGYDGRNRKQTSTYRVITTQSGSIVTAYPILP
jgi:hypothetical protein